jgi:hypothetical protein
MSVGVTEAGISVNGIAVCVAVEARAGSVGGGEAGVDKTSTEKIQALSNSVLNIKLIIDCNHLRGLIKYSFSSIP